MGAMTETYVDPSIAGNSGAGTSGDPYGDLQYALDTMTRDSTNGDRINIKSGTSELIATSLSLATYGTPTATAPLLLRGYASAAGDGDFLAGTGVGTIDMQGNNASIMAATSHVHWRHLRLTNTGSADIIPVGSYTSIVECEVDNGTGDGIQCASSSLVVGNYIHNIGAAGVQTSGSPNIKIAYNYLQNGTNKFTRGIDAGQGTLVLYNIVSLTSAAASSVGIRGASGQRLSIVGNSVLATSPGSSATGMTITGAGTLASMILNNVVEGFSGTANVGYNISSSSYDLPIFGRNFAYNNTTNYATFDSVINLGDNETGSASGFAKSGSDTFANRLLYFAPSSEGNMQGGAYQGAV